MRAATLLLALLLAPTAAAAVSVQDIAVPDRTAAGTAFDVRVRLVNDGPARDVHLFGALYEHVEGEGPCGPATDPRFRTFTHIVQETIRLPADAEFSYPPEGRRWLHRYEVDDAPPQPARDDFCVFVANATGGPTIEYVAFAATRLDVRAVNAAPVASFEWTPTTPRVGQDVRFEATGRDADGDPLTYRWDFGRHDAGGRATAQGATATHAFYPVGEYVVTLTASDGIVETMTTRTLGVTEAGGAEKGRLIPAAAMLALVAFALAAATGHRRG